MFEKKIEKIVNENTYIEPRGLINVNCDSINSILDVVYSSDQLGRNESFFFRDSIDSINQKLVISLIKKCGFPTKKTVKGNRQMNTIFLVLQHSSPKTMAFYYPLIKKSVQKGDMDKRYFALYQDRLLISYGEKQIYGSQIIDRGDGFHLASMVDPINVNKRRLKIGLEPIEDYLNQFGLNFEKEIIYLKSADDK